MFKLLAVRRLVAVVAFFACALLVAVTTTSAEAHSRYRGHHAHSHSSYHHHAGRHHARRNHAHRRHRLRHASTMNPARIERARNAYAALVPQDGVSMQSAPPPSAPSPTTPLGVVSNVVDEARRYLGGNPTGRSSLWCARFMNFVLQRSGHRTTGSDMASSFASYGTRVSGPQVGAIAVMSRGRRGGHVGVVSGIDAKGNPIVVSGNHGHRVAEATYSRSRVYAYVMPN